MNNNNNNPNNNGTGPNSRVPTTTQHIIRHCYLSRQRLTYTGRQQQSDTDSYVFSYKIHTALLILPAVLTQSINMDISVQTKVVTGYEKLLKNKPAY